MFPKSVLTSFVALAALLFVPGAWADPPSPQFFTISVTEFTDTSETPDAKKAALKRIGPIRGVMLTLLSWELGPP